MAGAPVVEAARRGPAPALRGHVAWYSGFRADGVPPGVHRGLPSPFLTLILTLDDPLVILAHPRAGQPPGRFDALVGGLHTSPAMIANPGRQSGVQVALHPLAARQLLGVPAGELAGQDVDLADVLGPGAHRLRERLLACPGWPERFAALDAALARRLSRSRPGGDVPAEVRHAWHLLRSTHGCLPAVRLAEQVGWSPRRLLDAFRREIGLSPKEAARVTRFHCARRRLFDDAARGLPPRLALLAVEHGYYDQAHLAREFRALAGCAPSGLVAAELRFVQAGGPDGEAAW